MSFFGAYIIYKAAPYEIKAYKNRRGPKERRRATFLFLTLGPVGVLAAVYLSFTSGLGMGLLALGLSLMPPGVFAYMDDRKVAKIDAEIATFFRSLGNVTESLGTTLSAAMAKLDRRSLGTLEPYIKRLQHRLRARISPKVCWERFMDEAGSELTFRSTRMFVDGVNLGGNPSKVGAIASDYAMDISLLRAKRYVVATPFAYLTVPLHGAMSALLVFCLEIMRSFNGKLAQATDELLEQAGGAVSQVPNLPVFQVKDMSQTTFLTLLAVVVLTIANTMAPTFATGGHRLNLLFYGSIMCTTSGINLLLIPPLAQTVLS